MKDSSRIQAQVAVEAAFRDAAGTRRTLSLRRASLTALRRVLRRNSGALSPIR